MRVAGPEAHLVYSILCQPETMFTPKRPPEMLSIVAAMRATMAGGMVSTAVEANSLMRVVTARGRP
jgi:hypothetical protein